MTLTADLVTLADQIANRYYLPGADRDDVQQEARIAAWVAVKGYDPAHGIPLRSFVGFVVHRRLKTAVKLANAGKHKILSDAHLLTERDPGCDMHDRVETIEELHRICSRVCLLSPLERRALGRSLGGERIESKSADNALTRARRKLAA